MEIFTAGASAIGAIAAIAATVIACLAPPGRPPRGIHEIRVRAPKGAKISRWRGQGAAWGDRVRYDPADPDASLFCRVDSPDLQVLRLRVRTGRWSWIETACEVADWNWLAEQDAHR